MKINQEIFRGYDIRGIVGKDLNSESIEQIVKAYTYFLNKQGINKVVVGYDCRQSSPEFSKIAIKALADSGIEVVDIGMCLVQMMYASQYYFKAKGGIMITASHNPKEFNGMKLANDYSSTLVEDQIEELKKYINEEKSVSGSGRGSVKKENIVEKYSKDLISRIKIAKKFKVVVDASNGTAGKFIPDLLRRVGCEVIEQNCQIDPDFPLGAPDPTEEMVAKRLSERVLAEKADLGFSYDADGDRMGIVDDQGNFIWNDILVAVFSEDVLAQKPGSKIVYNVLCSKVVEETILANGGKPIMWRTGHSFIKAKTKEEKAPFGGELSGHFYLDRFYGHDDGGYASLRLLEYLSKKTEKPSEIFAKFAKYISSPEIKIGCSEDKKIAFIEKVKKQIRQDFPNEKINEVDGSRVDFKDAMMVARYSLNGPYLTFKFEAKTQQKYNELKNYIYDLLKKAPEIDWSAGTNIETLKEK